MLHASRREAETGTLACPDCVWRRDGEWSGWRVQRGALSIRLAPSDRSPLFAADRDGDVTLSRNLLQMLDRVGDLTLDAEAISVASGALGRLRRTLFWRRYLTPSDRRIARQLRGILEPNRLTWLLMLKVAASSPRARREILSRAEQALGRMQTGAAARA